MNPGNRASPGHAIVQELSVVLINLAKTKFKKKHWFSLNVNEPLVNLNFLCGRGKNFVTRASPVNRA